MAEKSTYTVEFTPKNPMPQTGSIALTWPKQVGLVEGEFTCKVRTNRLFVMNKTNCVVDKTSRLIIITGVFVEILNGWANQISVEMGGMRNPVNNKEGTGFVIRTYEDAKQIYNMDKLDALKMKPILECPNPFIRLKNRIKDKEYT